MNGSWNITNDYCLNSFDLLKFSFTSKSQKTDYYIKDLTNFKIKKKLLWSRANSLQKQNYIYFKKWRENALKCSFNNFARVYLSSLVIYFAETLVTYRITHLAPTAGLEKRIIYGQIRLVLIERNRILSTAIIKVRIVGRYRYTKWRTSAWLECRIFTALTLYRIHNGWALARVLVTTRGAYPSPV